MLRTLAITLCLGLALAAPKAPQHKAVPEPKAPVAPPKAEKRDDWVAPEFCNGIDCPKYILLEANVEEVSQILNFSDNRTILLFMSCRCCIHDMSGNMRFHDDISIIQK